MIRQRNPFFSYALVALMLLSLSIPQIRTVSADDNSLVELAGSVSPSLGKPVPLADKFDLELHDEILVVLTPRNQVLFDTRTRAIQEPTSPFYRQPITEQDYVRNFAPSQASLDALKAYFKSYDLKIGYESSDRLMLSLKGQTSQFDRAFNTRSEYRQDSNGQSGLINVTPLKLPISLAKDLQGVVGFDNLHRAQSVSSGDNRTRIEPSAPVSNSNTPASVRTAYSIPMTMTGSGTAVGITFWVPPSTTDMTDWAAYYGQPLNLTILGNQNPLPPNTYNENDLRYEANQAVELVHLAAPQTAIRFYRSTSDSLSALAVSLNLAIDQNANALSNGWGTCERFISSSVRNSYHTIFQRAAARGIPVFYSSSDNGIFNCNNLNQITNIGYTVFPAGDDLVTAVGATSLIRESTNNTWVDETGWSCSNITGANDLTCVAIEAGSSGGGLAVNYARPSYQTAITIPTEPRFTNTPATLRRAVPDISTNGNPRSGVIVFFTDDAPTPRCNDDCLSGGTAASTAFMAGIAALAAQRSGGQVGGFNSYLYANFAGAIGSWSYDVTSGYNGVTAKTGWDFVTGLGSIRNVNNFVQAFGTPRAFLIGASNQFDDTNGNSNGTIDPGDSINVRIGLNNTGGASATAVSSTLIALSPNVSITSGTINYPTISSGAIVTNTTPYSFVLASNNQLCGQRLLFRQITTYNVGPASIYDFSLRVGSPQPTGSNTYTYGGGVVSIPDNNTAGITATIQVSSPNSVEDVNTTFTINHTFDSDLIIRLTSPAGTSVVLVQNQGGGGNNFTNTTLDDETRFLISEGVAPFTGDYQPETPLSTLYGEPLSGTWTLNIVDTAANDTGSLSAWSLRINELRFNCAGFGNPTPSIAQLSPSSLLAGSAGFTLGVTGTNFISTSVVNFNGIPQPTTFVSRTLLTANISSSSIITPGLIPVTVLNPTPGGGLSNIVNFTVTCNPFVVINLNDVGCGSLRNALQNATPNVSITIQVVGTINLTGTALPPVPSGVSIRGGCGANGPTVTINGNNIAGDGLVLTRNSTLFGLYVRGFNGKQIVSIRGGGGNTLSCVRASRN